MNKQTLDSLKLLYGINDIKKTQNGYSVGNDIFWEVRSDHRIKDHAELQELLGYSPCGYGISAASERTNKYGQWITKWSCYASCD